jgi:hydroxypyruvate isomerase
MAIITRREALAAGAAAAAAAAVSTLTPFGAAAQPAAPPAGRVVKKGRLKQSVARWCYKNIPDREFYKAVADMGLPAVDLLGPDQWEAVREFGLICSLGWQVGGTIPEGLNNPVNHDAIVKGLTAALPTAAKLGVPNLITFFGNRKGMSDADAIKNCVAGLNRIKGPAEDAGVTVVVELLNSKIDHKDYQGDRSAFGLEIVKAVGSPRVKLLYDIYHMQIMEGDVIRTIRQDKDWIAHFHTGGVPGRHELDETQELQWRSVCAAIADMGYTGYVAHEFVPTRDPLTSLREAVALCDV